MRRLAVALGTAAVLLVGDPALAQSDPIGDRLIQTLEGFTPGLSGADGPFDAAELADLGVAGGASSDDARRAEDALEEVGATGYLRSFGGADGTAVVVLGIAPIPEDQVAGFNLGLRSALRDVEDLPSPTGDERIAASSGTMPGLGTLLVAAIVSDDLAVVIQAIGPGQELAFARAVNAQAALTPPTFDARTEPESAAYRLGEAIGGLLVVGFLVGVVVLIVRRVRKKPTPPAMAGYGAVPGAWGPPPGPGAWGQAPPMPWGQPPPAGPPGAAHDPWAPQVPPAPPAAPPPDPSGPAPIE